MDQPSGSTVCNFTTFETKETVKNKRFTKRQWLTLMAIGGFHFSSAICISLQAPFYPQEAERKGATATEYGLVFGSFELVAFLSSPILGKYLHTLGVKTTLNCGIVIASISAICFGLLDMLETHTSFITWSFVLRMTESLGSTAALVAAFSITAAVFPENVATTFATLEVFYGLGYIVGPTLGGVLFSIGGYRLPFIVMGTIMSCVGVFVFIALPPIRTNDNLDETKNGMQEILKVPGVLLDSLSVICTSISLGYYAATLEPHIREFSLSPIANGLMFIIGGGVYAVVAPFVGRICDKLVYPKKIMAIGTLLVITSYLLVGPAPFLPLPTTLQLCIIGLVIHGFGVACLMVPTFIDSICSAVTAGFVDDITTYGLISGLWSSSFALGAFIGPSIAGLLFDLVGFRYGTLFVIAIHASLFIGMVCFITFEKRKVIPKKRIRMLSGTLIDSSTSSEEECLKANLTACWDQDMAKGCSSKFNGYGAIKSSDNSV